MSKKLIKNLKMGGLLTGLVTASIGITAFSLPKFNSVDTYFYKDVNGAMDNWNGTFLSEEEALKYLETVIENGLLVEERVGTRTIHTYDVTATMNGLDETFLDFENKSSIIDGNSTDKQGDYDAIRDEFMNLFTENFISQLQLPNATSNVYIPLDDYVSGGSTTSTGGTHALSEYFRGAGDSTYNTLDSAFGSLLDQTQIVFSYNGSNYDTISDVVLAWMTDNGFESNAAYKVVENHVSWGAERVYTDSAGDDHTFADSTTSADIDAFKASAQASFSAEMTKFETALITDHTYTHSEWESTNDYTLSRDNWIANNTIKTEPFINDNLLDDTLAEAFGYAYIHGNTYIIDGPGMDFFGFTQGPNWGTYWGTQWTSQPSKAIPSVESKIEDAYDFVALSMLAYATPEVNYGGWDFAKTMNDDVVGEFCSTSGVSQRNTDTWKSWTMYAEFMGFDNIVIPADQRPTGNSNTVNKWWEPDCEGVYEAANYSTNSKKYDHLQFLSDWFLPYFGYEYEVTNNNYNDMSSWYGGTKSSYMQESKSTWTFDETLYGGSLDGKTMTEALLEGGEVSATEEHYKATAADYQRDYEAWLVKQDVIHYWNGSTYRGKTEEEAYESVEAAIKAKVEADWININYTQEKFDDYDIDDAYLDAIRAIDPTIQTEDFFSIEAARTAVKSAVESNGADKIWNEVGLVSFKDDAFYGFDTTVSYNSIQEARDAVNWDANAEKIISAIGQSANFSTLLEYHQETVMKILDFNNTNTDIMFDMNISELVSKFIEGYDLSHLDSSLTKIEMDMVNFDDITITPDSEKEYATYRFSLEIDNLDLDETYWVTSAEFEVGNVEEHLPSLVAAKEELIKYWTDKISNENK